MAQKLRFSERRSSFIGVLDKLLIAVLLVAVTVITHCDAIIHLSQLTTSYIFGLVDCMCITFYNTIHVIVILSFAIISILPFFSFTTVFSSF